MKDLRFVQTLSLDGAMRRENQITPIKGRNQSSPNHGQHHQHNGFALSRSNNHFVLRLQVHTGLRLFPVTSGSRYRWNRGMLRTFFVVLMFQVVTSFIATASVAVLLAVYFTLLKMTPAPNEEITGRSLRRLLRRWLPGRRRKEFWIRVLERLILGFSDQQLITGTAMLIVGFSRLPESGGQISCYHFALTVDMVYFSAITHITTLSVLKSYFENSKYSVMRLLRLFGMTVMGILLAVAYILSLSPRVADSSSCPAQCFVVNWSTAPVTPFLVFGVTKIVCLVGFYLCAFLFPRPNMFKIWHLREGMQLFCYVFFFWGGPIFSLGIYEIVMDRSTGWEGQSPQNVWGFGQVLALLLLLLPALQSLDIYYGIQPCTLPLTGI